MSYIKDEKWFSTDRSKKKSKTYKKWSKLHVEGTICIVRMYSIEIECFFCFFLNPGLGGNGTALNPMPIKNNNNNIKIFLKCIFFIIHQVQNKLFQLFNSIATVLWSYNVFTNTLMG